MSSKRKTIRLGNKFISVDKDVYDKLKRRAGMRKISYEQLIGELLAANPI